MKKTAKIVALIIFLSLIIIPAYPVKVIAETGSGIEINKDNFPDPLFRNFLLNGSHYVWDEDNNQILVVYDANKDGMLSPDEISNMKQLLIAETYIRDLKGIEHLTSLIEINCQRSSVQKMDLSNNRELLILNCYKSNLQGELDLSSNIKLEGASCHNNKDLSAIDISGCKNLVSLTCDNTAVTKLDFSGNPKFRSLSCAATDISELDFSNNPELTMVSAYNTQITSFDTSSNPKLEMLDLSMCKLGSLDVSCNTALQDLNVSGNPIAWLNIGTNPGLTATVSDSTIDLKVPETHFDITAEIPGIDPGKVSIVSGGILNGKTVSGYSSGTPLIYTYDCGTSSNGRLLLTVTVNLTLEETGTAVPGTDTPSDGADKTPAGPASPATGDAFPMALCFLILALAGAVLVLTFKRKKY